VKGKTQAAPTTLPPVVMHSDVGAAVVVVVVVVVVPAEQAKLVPQSPYFPVTPTP